MSEYVLKFWEDDFDARQPSEIRARVKSVLDAHGGGDVFFINRSDLEILVKDASEDAADALYNLAGVRDVDNIEVETDSLTVWLIDETASTLAAQRERLSAIFDRQGNKLSIIQRTAKDRLVVQGSLNSEIADEILNSWQVRNITPIPPARRIISFPAFPVRGKTLP